jgi:hypothetical protein
VRAPSRLQLHNGAELGQAGVVLGLDVGIQETAGNILELLIADCFRLNVFFAHDNVSGLRLVWLVRSELRKRAELRQAVVISVLDVGV